MNELTYCITNDCKIKGDCKRSSEFEPGSFKSYAAFYPYVVEGIPDCDYFIEKPLTNNPK